MGSPEKPRNYLSKSSKATSMALISSNKKVLNIRGHVYVSLEMAMFMGGGWKQKLSKIVDLNS